MLEVPYQYILVKPDPERNKVRIGEVEILISLGYSGEYHSQSGVVVQVPLEMLPIPRGLNAEEYKPYRQFDVDQILQPGDRVFFHYHCIDDSSKLSEGLHRVSYELCYMFIRDGQVHIMDGWLMVEKLKENDGNTKTASGIILNPFDKPKDEAIKAKVVYAGKPCKRDRMGIELKPGDVIVHRKSSDVRMTETVAFDGRTLHRVRFDAVEGVIG